MESQLETTAFNNPTCCRRQRGNCPGVASRCILFAGLVSLSDLAADGGSCGNTMSQGNYCCFMRQRFVRIPQLLYVCISIFLMLIFVMRQSCDEYTAITFDLTICLSMIDGGRQFVAPEKRPNVMNNLLTKSGLFLVST